MHVLLPIVRVNKIQSLFLSNCNGGGSKRAGEWSVHAECILLFAPPVIAGSSIDRVLPSGKGGVANSDKTMTPVSWRNPLQWRIQDFLEEGALTPKGVGPLDPPLLLTKQRQ